MRLRFALRFALLGLVLLSSGCGVRFLDPEPGTELFEDLEISGTRTVDSELTIELDVTQAYPVAVQVACYYEVADKELTDFEEELGFHERGFKVAETLLPASTATRPDDEVEATRLRFSFSVPQPGRYFLACLTPASPENGIGKIFTVRRP